MPRKKKVEAPAAEAEVKAAEVVEAPAKKTTRKTAAVKKTTAAAPVAVETKTAAAPKTTKKTVAEEKAPAKAEVIIEYNEAKVPVNEIIKNAKIVVGEDKDITVYVKPGESKAYIVADGQTTEMDVFFCE